MKAPKPLQGTCNTNRENARIGAPRATPLDHVGEPKNVAWSSPARYTKNPSIAPELMMLTEAKIMMKAKTIARTMLPFLAVSVVALPTYPQNVTPLPNPQIMPVEASGRDATATYQCFVTTKDAGVEKTIIRAASEDTAKMAAVQKFGSRSIGLMGVSCAPTGSAMSPADSSAQKSDVKTRAPTPMPFEAIRPGVEFAADGSCRLSQQAIMDHPDARDRCQAYPTSKGVAFGCPAEYCETLK